MSRGLLTVVMATEAWLVTYTLFRGLLLVLALVVV